MVDIDHPDPNQTGRADEPRGTALLGIYLNDHLAGSTSGLRLARRLAATKRHSALGGTLAPLADEIARDREALRALMRALDVPERRYKIVAGTLAEAAGRFKPNGRLRRRSPLSNVIELEMLRIGVEGKAAVWTTLGALSGRYPGLDGTELSLLKHRARQQADLLDDLRLQAARDALTPSSTSRAG
jgi:hypothetical protein